MSVAVRLMLVVCVAFTSFSGEASAKKRVYLAMGDSIAFGAITDDPATQGHAGVLFAALRKPGRARVSRHHNIAQGGATTGSILGDQLDRGVRIIERKRTNTRLVTIDIGGNDLLGSQTCLLDVDSPSCPVVGNYRTLLSRLQSALAGDPGREDVLVLAYPNLWSGTGLPMEAIAARGLLGSDGAIDCAGTGDAVGLDDVLACVGAEYGAKIADPSAEWAGRGFELTHLPGDFHPNEAGHAVIAEAFLRVLRPAITAGVPFGQRI